MTTNALHERAWTRFLNSKNLSPATVINYLDATRALKVWLDDADVETDDLALVSAADLQGFFGDQGARLAPTTCGIRYRALQQFFKWAAEEEVRDDNPMLRVPRPVVPETSPEVLSMDQLKALLAAAGGKGFLDRRDNAIMRLFMEPGGARLSELTNLNVDGIDLGRDMVRVFGKGRKERTYPFGAKTGLALDRYLRVRASHTFGKMPHLWLGKKGALGNSGVQQMLRRRAAQVGIPRLYPHMFRHTAAHEWLDAGGNETDAVRLFGWSSPAMLQKYGRKLADQRAQDSARRLSLGDRY